MAQLHPIFGDQETADVILKLMPSEGPERPPLYLHSQALQKSEFFEARLSERWSLVDGVRPIELTLSSCRNVDSYVKCIQMMYSSEQFTFFNVQEALSILEVASELLFTDCLNSCMQYLEAVPWTAENEHQIRASIMSLQLQLSPDLAVRLSTAGCVQDFKPVNTMDEILSELLSLVSNGAPNKAREITKRVLRDNKQISTSPAFADVNKSALFRELKSNLELVKSQLRKFANFFSWNSHQITVASSALRWLLDEIFALQIADMAVKLFADEQDLAQLMVSRIYQNPFTETLFSILVRLLQALQIGEVICPRSVRLSLVTTWLPVIAKLTHDDEYLIKDNELHNGLEEGLSALVATLPMADQEQVFKIWISVCLKSRKAWPDLSTAFDLWCNKLRQAQCEKDLDSSLDISENVSEVEVVADRLVMACHSADKWHSKLQEAKTSCKLELVFFTASWCGPYRIISPVFFERSKRYTTVVFLKVDVNELQDLTAEWELQAMRTFIFIKDGKPIDKMVLSKMSLKR